VYHGAVLEAKKETPVNKLSTSRWLDGLGAEDIKAILRAAKEQRFSANSIVINQAHRAEHLFLLTHGHARHFFITEDGQKILLRWLAPGEITGTATLLSKPSRYLMGTEVVKDSRFLMWNRITLQRLTTRYPRLLQNLLSIAEVYLDWYLTAHIALTCDSARKRCASVLTNIGRAVGQEVAGGIELAITNEELASAAAITVYDASRFINDWQRSGVLAKTRGKVLVRSLDSLSREVRE
jgi:CRP/FNR family transcriptional regulator, nitrogen oxide reductase regulator